MGRLNPRLRDHVWQLAIESSRGRALLVFKDRTSEQGFGFRSNDHEWVPTDVEGVTLMMRRQDSGPRMKKGWSNASRLRSRKK